MIDSDNREEMQTSAAAYNNSTFAKLVYAMKRMKPEMSTGDVVSYVKTRYPDIHAEMVAECNAEDPQQFQDVDVNEKYQGSTFTALVEDAMKKDATLTKGAAIEMIAKKYPDVHEAAILHANGVEI